MYQFFLVQGVAVMGNVQVKPLHLKSQHAMNSYLNLNAISQPRDTQPTLTDASAQQKSRTNHLYILSASGRLHLIELNYRFEDLTLKKCDVVVVFNWNTIGQHHSCFSLEDWYFHGQNETYQLIKIHESFTVNVIFLYVKVA